MRWSIPLSILIVTLSLLVVMGNTSIASTASTHYHIYIFGSTRCPHTVNMIRFLSTHFNGTYTFCDMNKYTSCAILFSRLINITGLEPVIPITLVASNSTVEAIIVGELENETFWSELLATNSSNEKYIPVYVMINGTTNIVERLPSSYRGEILHILNSVNTLASTAPRKYNVTTRIEYRETFASAPANPYIEKGILLFLVSAIAYVSIVEGIIERKRR
jgi:hypothetical protein